MNPTTIKPDITRIASAEIEKSIIGALHAAPDMLSEVRAKLPASAFYFQHHRWVYEAMLDLHASGRPVDVVALHEELGKTDKLEKAGGPQWLMELCGGTPYGHGWAYYCDRLNDLALRRSGIALGQRLNVNMNENQEDAASDILDRAQADLVALKLASSGCSKGREQREIVTSDLREIEAFRKLGGALPGLSTGLNALDHVLLGLQPSRLYVLAGVTGSGKSTLATNVAYHIAAGGHRVAYFSLEMRGEELVNRQAAAWSYTDADKISSGRVLSGAVADAMSRISAANMITHDRANDTVESIQSHCRGYATMPGGLALAVVDYAQLVGYSKGEKRTSREEHVAAVSRGLKLLAMELGIPVLACAQLNRDSLKRDDHMPRLGELRESGALEQDADVVMAVHRPILFGDVTFDAKDRGKTNPIRVDPHDAKLVILKNRSGRQGFKPLHFDGARFKFSDVVHDVMAPY